MIYMSNTYILKDLISPLRKEKSPINTHCFVYLKSKNCKLSEGLECDFMTKDFTLSYIGRIGSSEYRFLLETFKNVPKCEAV